MLSWDGSMLNRTALWMGSRSEAAARSARPEAEAARKVRRVMRIHSTTLAALTKIDDAETAHRRLFGIQEIFERRLAQSDFLKVIQLPATQGPRHLAGRIIFVACASNHQQPSVLCDEAGRVFHRPDRKSTRLN